MSQRRFEFSLLPLFLAKSMLFKAESAQLTNVPLSTEFLFSIKMIV